jgi:hypothetical protein
MLQLMQGNQVMNRGGVNAANNSMGADLPANSDMMFSDTLSDMQSNIGVLEQGESVVSGEIVTENVFYVGLGLIAANFIDNQSINNASDIVVENTKVASSLDIYNQVSTNVERIEANLSNFESLVEKTTDFNTGDNNINDFAIDNKIDSEQVDYNVGDFGQTQNEASDDSGQQLSQNTNQSSNSKATAELDADKNGLVPASFGVEKDVVETNKRQEDDILKVDERISSNDVKEQRREDNAAHRIEIIEPKKLETYNNVNRTELVKLYAKNSIQDIDIVEQVKMHIAKSDKHGNTITVQLNPVELGKVEIRMDMLQDGKFMINVIADKAETAQLLERNSHSLEKSLFENGVRGDNASLSFSFSGNQSQQQQQASKVNNAFYDSQQQDDDTVVSSYLLNIGRYKRVDIRV